jgi:hypothetical protein
LKEIYFAQLPMPRVTAQIKFYWLAKSVTVHPQSIYTLRAEIFVVEYTPIFYCDFTKSFKVVQQEQESEISEA